MNEGLFCFRLFVVKEKGELNLFFSFGIGKNTISAFSFYFTYSWAGVNKMGINLRVSFRKSIVRAGVV